MTLPFSLEEQSKFLYCRHTGLIFNYVNKFYNNYKLRSKFPLEELLNEVFLAIENGLLKSFRPPRPFPPFLRTHLYWFCLHYIKKANCAVKSSKKLTRHDSEIFSLMSEKDSDIIQHRDDLYRLLNKLPERRRYILSQRYGLLDGKPKTCEYLAQELKVTRAAISHSELTSIKMLRKFFEE